MPPVPEARAPREVRSMAMKCEDLLKKTPHPIVPLRRGQGSAGYRLEVCCSPPEKGDHCCLPPRGLEPQAPSYYSTPPC